MCASGVYILTITPPPRGGERRVTKQGSNRDGKEKKYKKKGKKEKIRRKKGQKRKFR